MKQIIYLLSLMTLLSCATKKEKERPFLVGHVKPQSIIYKTKKDYADLVPIQMDKTKTKIVGFPAPSDLKRGNGLSTPVKIKDGYYLDKRGINANTVFINIDYATYARLKKVPSMDELRKSIVDKNPFVEMYACPNINIYTPIDELKELVDKKFPNCTKINL